MIERKILTVHKSNDRYRHCNVCCSHDEKKVVNELMFGHDGQSISVMICDKCLSEFADKLWEYLDERCK